jgi:hypothetical protein
MSGDSLRREDAESDEEADERMRQLQRAVEADPYVLHSDRQEDDITSELKEIEPSRLLSPLLNHVGIVDLNKAWEQLGNPMQEQLAKSAVLGGHALVWSVRYLLEDAVFDRLRIDDGTVGIDSIQAAYYPVIGDSFIGNLASTELWERARGISQLGWNGSYPLSNTHSRGSHEFITAINIVRVLQELYDKDAGALAARLRADFMDESFYDESMTDMEICLLAAKLGALTGMSHDIATPAGGDMMKRVMGMDEEEDLKALLYGSDPDAKEYRDVTQGYGLDEQHLAFMLKCVQGESHSLIGDMIHTVEGDHLEQDRLSYTFHDLQSSGVLRGPIARSLFNDDSLAEYEEALRTSWQQAYRLLKDEKARVTHTMPLDSSAPSLTLLDPVNDYALDIEGRLVNTRPDKLAWLAAFRAMMSVEYYQGAKLRGQEYEIACCLMELIKRGRANDILNRDNLLKVTSEELYAQLRTIDDPELQRLLKASGEWVYPYNYQSEIVPLSEDVPDVWFSFPVKIKAGLDTPVVDGGIVKRLGDYMKEHPDAVSSRLLGRIEDEYGVGKRVMYGAKSI